MNLLGWYDRGNCGDEAFKDALGALFPKRKLTFSTDEAPSYPVLGGGDVVKPAYLDLLKDKPFYILGAGLGYESEINLLKDLSVREAFFRNQRDVSLAIATGLKAYYTPDLAFALQPVVPRRRGSTRKRLGILLTDCVSPAADGKHPKEQAYGEYLKWELAVALHHLAQWYDLIFISMSHAQYGYDVRMAYDVMDRMPGPANHEVLQPDSPEQTLGLIAGCDVVLTMRFHGLIFAVISGVPFINIGLTRKTEQFCLENGLSPLTVPPYGLTKDRLLHVMKNAERRDLWQPRLQEISRRNAKALQDVVRHVNMHWSLS